MSKKISYTVAQLEKIKLTSEQLLSSSYNEDIVKRLAVIIEAEAPICEPLLIKRLLNSYSLYKCGSRLSAFLSPILGALPFENETVKDQRVYFVNKNFDYYRATSEEIRYSYQIPYQEGAQAIKALKETSGKKSTKAELLNLFTQEFEYKKKGKQVVRFFNESYDYYKHQ